MRRLTPTPLHNPLCSTVLAAVIVSLASTSEGARTPTILPVPAQGVAFTHGEAINAGGAVVGGADFDANGRRAFFWLDRNRNRQSEAGEVVDLGKLDGTHCFASGINRTGQVVGESGTASGFPHAFSWQDRNRNRLSDPGEMIDLGTLGGNLSRALDINNQGLVTGYSRPPFGSFHAFVWQDRNRNRLSDAGEMIDLGTLPGGNFTLANALNDRGQVVGDADSASGVSAFLWQDRNRNRRSDPGEMIALDSTGQADSTATDINAKGQVVGSIRFADPVPHAYVWQDRNRNSRFEGDEMIDLGTFGGGFSVAKAINAGGEVVGTAADAQDTQQPFYWKDRNRNRRADPGEMVNLLSLLPSGSGWTYLDPRDINDRGQVTGTGVLNGQDVAFVLNLR